MNLFLEGPIRIGKSTALQNILRPVQAHVGGIIVQRLWQDGIIVGFRSVALDGKFPTLDVKLFQLPNTSKTNFLKMSLYITRNLNPTY